MTEPNGGSGSGGSGGPITRPKAENGGGSGDSGGSSSRPKNGNESNSTVEKSLLPPLNANPEDPPFVKKVHNWSDGNSLGMTTPEPSTQATLLSPEIESAKEKPTQITKKSSDEEKQEVDVVEEVNTQQGGFVQWV